MNEGAPHGLLMLCPELAPRDVGGVGAWAQDLAAALQAAGERPLVAAPARGGPLPAAAFPIAGMLGHRWARWGEAWAGLAALRLRARCDEDAPLLAATWPMASWAAEAWAGPVLVACHGSELTALQAAPAALRRLDQRAVFLPVSAFLEGELRRLGLRAPAVRLPMALEAAPAPLRRAGRALVVSARPTPHKGLDHALRLAAGLGRPLWLVGCTAGQLRALCAGGPSAAAAAAAVDRAPGADRGWPAAGEAPVVCFGRLARPVARRLLEGAAAAALLPRADPDGRRAEGLGLSLIEAAALGLPTLALPVGGAGEAIGPGRVLPEPGAWGPELFSEINVYIDNPTAGHPAWRWAQAAHGPGPALAALRGALALAQPRAGRG